MPGLGITDLRRAPEQVHETLVCLLKTQQDRAAVAAEVTERLIGKVA